MPKKKKEKKEGVAGYGDSILLTNYIIFALLFLANSWLV